MEHCPILFATQPSSCTPSSYHFMDHGLFSLSKHEELSNSMDGAGDDARSSPQVGGESSPGRDAGGGQADVVAMKTKGKKRERRPRYAFQTRSQADILDDGYRWRKYGQKAVKDNNFPRSYYRCTHQGCNVKKQVQRLSRDEGVVVTTYEGTHTHPIEKSNENFEHILTQMQVYSTVNNRSSTFTHHMFQ
ncbi:probable WRKY transcription factor 75 [Lolium perenne]|uniref:probable WRKY transcription factor 75 n=1 Tax=Lolium perenne TaxID=4522 RepID=UPI0021F55CF1|nr:probable WRKY transcription factor 75 [Lolium perenne]